MEAQVSDEIVLQTVNLGKKYGARWAVQGLNLTVRRGEVFGFLGPNGAGKSTTIRMILSLITPSTGSVDLFGLPLRENRGTVLSRVGGLVERADFYLYLSARRNLEIIAALIGGISASAIGEVLETVGLASRAGDRVKSYSHGMKQRLGLAAALLGSPELVVLDEPTGGLDPYGIKEVRDLIARLAAERNVTVFLSSHLLSEIEQLATSMAIINNGSLVVQGSVRDLLGAGTGTVDVVAIPADRALGIIRSLPYVVEAAPAEAETIRVKVPAADAGRMNAELVRAGIEVRSLVPRRSLEEYFLSLTGEGGRQ
jgi:ABC-type multidrug transport system ATPase subunit